MIISISDPNYWDFSWLYWALGIFVLLVLLCIVLWSTGVSEAIAGPITVVTGFWFVFAVVLTGFVQGEHAYDNARSARIVESLEEVGFSHVDLEGESGDIRFSADLEGEYFDGILIYESANTWSVNEIESGR